MQVFAKKTTNSLVLKIFCTTFAVLNQGAIAQMVEQRTENPCVPGSIPGGTTKETLIFNRKSGLFIPQSQKTLK